MRIEIDIPSYSRGLVIPDSHNETPIDSLSYAENVSLTERGAIRQRYGSSLSPDLFSPSALESFGGMFTTPTEMVVLDGAGAANAYKVGTTAWSKTTTYTPSGSIPKYMDSYARMADPTTAAPMIYLSRHDAVLTKYNPSATSRAFSTVANSPKCRSLAQGLASERMWAAGFDTGNNGPGGAAATSSTVWWSDPGNAESWNASSFQDFAPGDGEPIMGLASFNGQIFVFKQSRFWVIYSINSGGGTTTVNYREVNGAGLARYNCFSVTNSGIYFLGLDGVYVTTGGIPTKISGQIDGFFTGRMPSWTTYTRMLPPVPVVVPGISVSIYPQTMAIADDCLYLLCSGIYSSATAGVLLVYDIPKQAWTVHQRTNTAAIAAVPWGNLASELLSAVYYSPTLGSTAGMLFHPQLLSDTTAEFAVGFRGGWFEANTQAALVWQDKRHIRRIQALGSGIAQVGVSVDFAKTAIDWKTMDFGSPTWDNTTDVWGNGSDPADVWGDGTVSTDVWGYGGGGDYLRLPLPTSKFAYNPSGRGRYLSVGFKKLTGSSYFYVERPRLTVEGRGG